MKSYRLLLHVHVHVRPNGLHDVNMSIMNEWIQFLSTGTSITLKAFNTRTENQISGL